MLLVQAPRIGRAQAVTPPIIVNDESNTDNTDNNAEAVGKGTKSWVKASQEVYGRGGGVHMVARLRPTKKGRHIVVISNCAAEVSYDEQPNQSRALSLKAVIGEVEVTFVSKFGELPLSMMGIIPFYGTMFGFYMVLVAIWWKRSWGKGRPGVGIQNTKTNEYDHANADYAVSGRRSGFRNESRAYSAMGLQPGTKGEPPLLGLQRAIRTLVFAQAAFTAVAFSYYLHLNWTTVDVDTLYSGTAAALISWGPWSLAVAAAHFSTILGCQAVVTLATDGKWLIQHTVRPDTVKALYYLAAVWAVFFLLYGFLTPRLRVAYLLVFGFVWVLFLLYNVRRSLRHLRSLMVGQASETVMAVGGAIVAKRSLYRKMCGVIAAYPVIFLVSIIWNASVSAHNLMNGGSSVWL